MIYQWYHSFTHRSTNITEEFVSTSLSLSSSLGVNGPLKRSCDILLWWWCEIANPFIFIAINFREWKCNLLIYYINLFSHLSKLLKCNNIVVFLLDFYLWVKLKLAWLQTNLVGEFLATIYFLNRQTTLCLSAPVKSVFKTVLAVCFYKIQFLTL